MRIPHGCNLSVGMIKKIADDAAAYRKQIGETESMPLCVLYALDKNKALKTSANQSAVNSELSERSKALRAFNKALQQVPFSDQTIDAPAQLSISYPEPPLSNKPGQTYMRYARGD